MSRPATRTVDAGRVLAVNLADRLGTVRAARSAGLALIAVFVVARLVRAHSPAGFVVVGSRFLRRGAPGELHASGFSGYDGQFIYHLAVDPFTRSTISHGMILDDPGYRQQRIATAALAHVVAWLPGIGTALALILVNVLALCVAVWAGTRIAADAGRHPGWGLVLAAPACMPISLGRDLTEPVAWAAILTGLLLARRGRWSLVAAALTVAVLARETSLLVVVGLGAGAIWHGVSTGERRTARPAAWLLVPVAVEAAWQDWLAHVWGSLPIHSGEANTSPVPLVGVLRSMFDGPVSSASNPIALGGVYLVERVTTLLLIATAAWLIWRRRTDASAGEAISWLLAVLLALSVRSWRHDVQFLRATYEAWGLSVLVLVGSADLRARQVLAGAGAVTLGVALMYTVVV